MACEQASRHSAIALNTMQHLYAFTRALCGTCLPTRSSDDGKMKTLK